MVTEIGLIQAWGHWANEISISDHHLWGLSIRWWSRIGKILALVSALTILAEIIGVRRLRGFAVKLRDLQKTSAIQSVLHPVRESKVLFTFFTLKNVAFFDRFKIHFEETSKTFTGKFYIFYLILLLISIITSTIKGFTDSNFLFTILYATAMILLSPVFATIIIPINTFLMFLWLYIPVIVFYFIVSGIAWTLSVSRLDKAIKVSSVFMLTAGFHFDLLGS